MDNFGPNIIFGNVTSAMQLYSSLSYRIAHSEVSFNQTSPLE